MPDRLLASAIPGSVPRHEDVQQLIEAERGEGTQGVKRAWQASNSDKVVLISDQNGVRISRDNGVTAPAQVIVDGTTAGGSLSGTYPNPSVSVATIDALLPPGTIWAYGGAAAPTGWLLCDGTVISRTTYAKLFAVVSTTYNTGGEAGTDFRLPDLRGRVPLGVSGSHARGTVGGAETVVGPPHTHPGSHSHGMNSHTHGMSSHTHTLGSHTHPGAAHTHTLGSHTHPGAAHTHTLGTHTHTPGSHSHALASTHTHGMTNHDHTLNGHFHNAAALGVGGTIGTSSGVATTLTGAGQNVSDDNHTHGHSLDVNGQTDNATGNTSGATNYTDGSGLTGTAGAGSTGAPSAASTGGPTGGSDGPSAASTGVPSGGSDGPSAASTGGPTGGSDAASPAASEAATGTTAPDSTAAAASFPGTVATLPPFQAVQFIIRTGA